MKEKKWIILMVVLFGPFMATLDSSIVNVALPVISKNLSVDISSVQWVVTSYLIVISGFILVFGKIADMVGREKVFQNGFIVFTVGSLLCGLSYTLKMLVCFRILQAIGAAMLMSSNQAIIAETFPKEERGRALGLSGASVALGTMIGPPLGGIITGNLSWEYVFFINIPIGIVAYLLGMKVFHKKITGKINFNTLDVKGAIVFFVFIVSLFWGLLNGEQLDWNNIYIIISLVIAIISGITFYNMERKNENPLLNFDIFSNGIFTISIFCSFISFMAIFCTNIIHPFYLQYVLKLTPQVSGALMMAYPVSIAIVAPLSGALSDKFGSEKLTIVGLLITVLGLIMLSYLNLKSTYVDIVFRIALVGIGNGFFQSPNSNLIMSEAPKKMLGTVGSINGLTRNMGMVSGIAFSVSLLYNRMSYYTGNKITGVSSSNINAFLYGMRWVYISAAMICVVGVGLTLMRLRGKKNAN